MDKISAQDLRIGNYVMSGKGIYSLSAISNPYCIGIHLPDNKAVELQLGLLSPIPLTPELLERCGFVKTTLDETPYEIWTHSKIEIWNLNGMYWVLEMAEQAGVNLQLKYLHHLQNIVHALTTIELDVKM